ncbi:uncharacterized protein MONOS_9028 [Monocercomonoides exilis]|uniref:uncharacterized protein n=1 Tax=Monocercomonoides exilis TaxID=2049356 RepID=UPI00355A55DE|nr:hypothetical protein MONOS_9028 [Monocercomonoides exilis]|eukprot:MONOS_9028.1-p1 / transcript=MONOS_9028.1 / gene=MONOS_9028 / organism=Monocercomonoides_exilis_PA203 / gene_product=unspecified product / transcript_product=unspecified product / location=Mono_scaffold00358:55441-56150(-) / protein_length=190 / sequence_SO=supercontig / SO=protein_coding / is_pseudo=false
MVKLDDKVIGRGIAVYEMDKRSDGKALESVCSKMEDVVLSPAAIAQAVLEEGKEEEVGKEKEANLLSGLAEQLQEKNEIILKKKKILELSEEHNAEVMQSSESLILPLGLCEKCQEKLTEIIRDGIAFLLGPDTSRKMVVVKVESEVSDVGEGNSGRRKSVCGGGRADATVREKMSKMKNEMKMQMVLS